MKTANTLIEISKLDRLEGIRLFLSKYTVFKKSMAYVQDVFIPLLPEAEEIDWKISGEEDLAKKEKS